MKLDVQEAADRDERRDDAQEDAGKDREGNEFGDVGDEVTNQTDSRQQYAGLRRNKPKGRIENNQSYRGGKNTIERAFDQEWRANLPGRTADQAHNFNFLFLVVDGEADSIECDQDRNRGENQRGQKTPATNPLGNT